MSDKQQPYAEEASALGRDAALARHRGDEYTPLQYQRRAQEIARYAPDPGATRQAYREGYRAEYQRLRPKS